MSDARRSIPSVERLLASAEFEPLLADQPRPRVTDVLRRLQDDIRSGAATPETRTQWYADEVAARLEKADRLSICDVINATGVVLHTNLGRAPLAQAALAAIRDIAPGYSNLEYDLAAGGRGSRYTHCRALLCELTGAEAALVVNNNAAALVLALNTMAMGKRVLVSRGELVEIGDSFRIAEIIERSGATVAEVGATNRTHLKDYATHARDAAAILKVHPSNYQTSGFVAAVPIAELAPVARSASLPLVYDLGSGLIESLEDIGLSGEPTVAEALADGADVVTMSGDKLLGGPQAGIILGRADLVQAMQRNPLCRALRVDKLTIAALEATLQCYARGTARRDIPALRMLAITIDELRARSEKFTDRLNSAGIVARVVPGASAVGGGAFPAVELPGFVIEIDPPRGATRLEEALRNTEPPVILRLASDHALVDLRTVLPEQEESLLTLLVNAC